MKIHLLFEQSGVFKEEFKKLGYEAFDYDINNEYGKTDYRCDLYKEIEEGYEGRESIFDRISEEDMVMAFFPCTRFENQCLLWFRGENYAQRKAKDTEKLMTDIRMHRELSRSYEVLSKLAILALRKGIKLVIENPYSEQHYLVRYWCLKPAVIDRDRRENGDYYKKPTQYYFIGFEPKNNLVFEAIDYVETRKQCEIGWESYNVDREKERSEIHPQYANRFIRQYLI